MIIKRIRKSILLLATVSLLMFTYCKEGEVDSLAEENLLVDILWKATDIEGTFEDTTISEDSKEELLSGSFGLEFKNDGTLIIYGDEGT